MTNNFLLLFAALSLFGCADLSGGSKFHSIRVGNGGHGAIVEPSIEYGDAQLINKSQTLFPPPNPSGQVGDFVIQGATLPLAKQTVIKWKSANGFPHVIVVPTASLIRNKNVFYGWHFVFIDERVSVYTIERRQFNVPTSALETFETLVFSSP